MKFLRCPALFALIAVLALPVITPAVEPTNLDFAKGDLLRYINSGEYFREVSDAAIKANKYLAKRLNKPAQAGEKLAIVLDIDETAVSNLAHFIANDFGYVPAVWQRYVASAQAKAIVPVQVGYDMAVRANIAVFFISERKESQRASTEKNLREVGYDTWTRAYFMPNEAPEPIQLFKTKARRQIVDDGYTIILNIGDQESDLRGGYAQKTFKLPNPIYRTN